MERSPDSDGSMLDSDEALERSREVLGSPLQEKSTPRDSILRSLLPDGIFELPSRSWEEGKVQGIKR